jgi:hypothetical protein
MSLAAIFAGRYPFRADDLGGQALWLLTKSVTDYPKKARDNRIRGFLHNRVWHGLQRYCSEDHLIKVTESTLRYQKEKGNDLRFSVGDVDKVLYGRERPDPVLLDTTDPGLETENLELIHAEITEDAEILQLRLLGFGDVEIADATLLPIHYIVERRKQIINRLTFVLRRLEFDERDIPVK